MSSEIIGALTQWKTKLKPISKVLKSNKPNDEKPQVKWGTFVFDGDDNLYCPFCYNNKGVKMLTSRVDSHNRQCTSCGKILKS